MKSKKKNLTLAILSTLPLSNLSAALKENFVGKNMAETIVNMLETAEVQIHPRTLQIIDSLVTDGALYVQEYEEEGLLKKGLVINGDKIDATFYSTLLKSKTISRITYNGEFVTAHTP